MASERDGCPCPICRALLDLAAAACGQCGTPLAELALVTCASCQETNSPEAGCCRACAEVLTDKSQEARAFSRTFIQWLKDAGYRAEVVRGIPCYTQGSALVLIINEELLVGTKPIHIIRFRSDVVRGLNDPRLIARILLKANASLLLGSFGLEDDRIVYRYDWVTTDASEELFLVIAGMIGEIVDSTDDYLAELTGGETSLGGS